MMKVPGPLLAAGRDADIYAYGPGLVLRRSREGRSLAFEARIMDYVRAHGYPAPAVEGVSDDGLDLIMERIEGTDMATAMAKRPWTIRRQGSGLADLHLQLHEIPAPAWLHDAPVSRGDRVLHLDLHPLNVILSPRGPVVIDWTGASRGDPVVDVALAWILMVAGSVSTGRLIAVVLDRGRRALVNSFLRSFDMDALKRTLRDVVAWKVLDPHMSSAEQARMWQVVKDAEAASSDL